MRRLAVTPLLLGAACLGPVAEPGLGAGNDGETASGSSMMPGPSSELDGGSSSPPGGDTSGAPARASGGGGGASGGGTGNTPHHFDGLVIAAVGDYGTDNRASGLVADLIASWDPELVITTGDNNYPIGSASTIDEHIGRYYSAFIGSYVGRYGKGSETNRFWPSPGNHDWGSADLVPYRDYFDLPGNERYYDVDLGVVHLFAIDSDSHEPDGKTADGVQAMWLRDRLAASTACWNLVYFHHPAYSSAAHGSDLTMRWPFAEWGADVVLAGHDHSYERLLVDGIPYFVTGLGGASRYPFGELLPETQARYNDDFGALAISATDRDITFEFIATSGEVIDVSSVYKSCDG